ncbi:MAG: hypothetical protein EAX86_00780 [Candidatus Heimdallarchaeota archaeon]|nr:hypothetical protein [Candidatus Heimdallarchaeota archaeon]
MKRKILIGISVITLLFLLTFTTSVQATEFGGHTFSEEYFAIEVDLAVPDPSNPDLIKDLINPGAATGDTDEFEDHQFYMAYMNDSGIETAFSALEKMEHDITFGELLDDAVYDILHPYYPGPLDTTIFHVNATAPFQQLVQHFKTPEDQDVFVTNNFMALIAYSSDPNDRIMDSEDKLYLGYTFSIQELVDAVNGVLEDNMHDYRIGHFDYSSSFEKVGDVYKFGIRYENMFVLWQEIGVAPTGVDIFGAGSQYIQDDTRGIIYGRDIVAASVLDYISFDYEFKTQEMIGANKYVLGTVTTHYNIGETNFLVINENTLPTADWNHTPFVAAPSYTFDVPDDLAGFSTGLPAPLPSAVTVTLNEMAFYLDDDAKARMRMANGFGLTVATATTTFGISLAEDPSVNNQLENETSRTIDLVTGGNTFFFTEFTNKNTYKLKGLFDLWGIDPNADRPVYIIPFTPSDTWVITNVAREYFAVEFAYAYGFTKFLAYELSDTFSMAGTADVYVSSILYFTFTEFSEWYGGEIYHDPAYSAVAALAVDDTSDTGTPPGNGFGAIPGFELISTFLALPPLYAIYRKRRR